MDSAPCVFNSMWFPPLTTIYKILIQVITTWVKKLFLTQFEAIEIAAHKILKQWPWACFWLKETCMVWQCHGVCTNGFWYFSLPLNMQIYAEMIGNVMIDARSTGKYYHCKFTNTKFTSLFSTFLAISL